MSVVITDKEADVLASILAKYHASKKPKPTASEKRKAQEQQNMAIATNLMAKHLKRK